MMSSVVLEVLEGSKSFRARNRTRETPTAVGTNLACAMLERLFVNHIRPHRSCI